MVTTSNKGNADRVIAASFASAGLLCHPAGEPKQRLRARQGDEGAQWRASAKDPGTVGVNYGYRGWTNGKVAVSWHSPPDYSEPREVFYRGERVASLFDDEAFGYFFTDDAWRVPGIIGCTIGDGYIYLVTCVEHWNGDSGFYSWEAWCLSPPAATGEGWAPSKIFDSQDNEAMQGFLAQTGNAYYSPSLTGRRAVIIMVDITTEDAESIFELHFSPGRAEVTPHAQHHSHVALAGETNTTVTSVPEEYFDDHIKYQISWSEYSAIDVSGRCHIGARWKIVGESEDFDWVDLIYTQTEVTSASAVGHIRHYVDDEEFNTFVDSGGGSYSCTSTLKITTAGEDVVVRNITITSTDTLFDGLWGNELHITKHPAGFLSDLYYSDWNAGYLVMLKKTPGSLSPISVAVADKDGVAVEQPGGVADNGYFHNHVYSYITPPSLGGDWRRRPDSLMTLNGSFSGVLGESRSPLRDFRVGLYLSSRPGGYNPNGYLGVHPNGAFVSTPMLGGGVLNYLTDNPSMTGVFPDEIDLDGAFYPIVPV